MDPQVETSMAITAWVFLCRMKTNSVNKIRRVNFERKRDGQIDMQIDRQIDRERERKTKREKRKKEREREREKELHIYEDTKLEY